MIPALFLTIAGLHPQATQVHSITDLSHEFSFYADGRFARQYLPGGKDARNWGTLAKADLRNANLLVLMSGPTACPYSKADVAAVRAFLEDGGGVAVLGSFGHFREETGYRLNEFTGAFGARFEDRPAKSPLQALPGSGVENIEFGGGSTIRLDHPEEWRILIQDAEGATMLATKRIGPGTLLLGARGLAGHRPDASDPINAAWWQPILRRVAGGRAVDPNQGPRTSWAELTEERDGITLEYTEYTKPYADAVFGMYRKVRPLQEKLLGVPPASGNLAKFLLLPTDGGGFSSGDRIGIAVWWGGFPEQTYGMVELIGHEATHSWVLPFAEPMWNEGLATYVGIQLGKAMGLESEADRTLKNWIESARREDPEMKKLDITVGQPHAVAMAKPMWIWEELRKERPDILSRYFRAKRALVSTEAFRQYTADDCVAVLSTAMGRDLFPWFRSLGVNVDRSNTRIRPPDLSK